MDVSKTINERGHVMEVIHLPEKQVSFPKSPFVDVLCEYKGAAPYHVNYCGYEDCTPGHAAGPSKRSSYLMHIIFGGKGVLETGGKTYHLSKNQVFMVFPGETSYYRADEEDPWSYGWVGFKGFYVESLIDEMGFSKENPVIYLEDVDPLRNCIANIYETSKITTANELYRTAELLKIIAFLIEKNTRVGQKEDPYSKETYAMVAMQYLNANYMNHVKIADIAADIGIDRCYLSKLFKTTYRISPQQYLVKVRMEKACDRLLQTDDSVIQVAMEVGYADSLAFSRIFRQTYGVSPSEYRARNKRET